MTDRSDAAIRADLDLLAVWDAGSISEWTDDLDDARDRLWHDVAPLLARAVAAEARAEAADKRGDEQARVTVVQFAKAMRYKDERDEARARVAAVALVRERMRNANFWQIGREAWEGVEAELDAALAAASPPGYEHATLGPGTVVGHPPAASPVPPPEGQR